ncbi:Uncharacterised protein [Bartonella grahamii]|uniref:Uncharacterized protein n=1 Tax=Bartonella grahamii TaxID=33045 RepID=A0A336NB44_BARGR|nr:Uncharacterised protein [Bartonella grahamii]
MREGWREEIGLAFMVLNEVVSFEGGDLKCVGDLKFIGGVG